MRERASRALDDLPGDTVAALVAIAERERLGRMLGLCMVFGIHVVSRMVDMYREIIREDKTRWLPWPVQLLVLILCAYFLMARKSELYPALALAEYDDIRATGPLIDALEWQPMWGRVDRSVFVLALARLLPLLRRDNANLLTPRRRIILYHRLKARTHPRRNPAVFKVAILKALAEIQGRGALSYVREVVDRPAKTSDDLRVQAAARECLLLLRK